MLVPSGEFTSVMAPAVEFACSPVFPSELACISLGGGGRNAVAVKSGVRQGGRIWSASTLL